MARSAGQVAFDVVGDASSLANSVESDLGKSLRRLFLGGAGAFALAKISKDIGGFVKQGVADFASFETEMTRVFQVLPDLSSSAMQSMKDDITSLSSEYGVAVDEIAKATAVAAGRSIQDLEAFEAATTRLAATVGADATNISTVVSAAMNQYGQDTLGAAQASDILYAAARKSGLGVDKFGRALYDVLPSAVSLGISFEETAATIATMTAAGTPAAVATTRLRTALYELGRETTKSGEAFRSVAGLSFTEFIEQGGTVAQAIDVLNEASAETGTQLRDMVDSFYTADQIIALSGPNAERYTESLKGITAASGEVERAQKQAFETVEYQLGIAQNTFANTRREFVKAFGPTQLSALKLLNRVLAGLVGPVERLSGAIEGFLADNAPEIERFGAAFENAIGQSIARSTTAIEFLGPLISGIALNLITMGEAALNAWRIISEVFGPITIAGLGVLLTAVLGVTEVLAFMADIVNKNQLAFKVLVGVFAGAVIMTKTYLLLTRALIAVKALMLLRFVSLSKAVAVLRVGIIALGWAFAANPIGFFITALTSAAIAFKILWSNSETFRRIVAKVLNTTIDGFIFFGKAFYRYMILPWDVLLGVMGSVADGAGWLLSKIGVDISGVGDTIDAARSQLQGFANSLNALNGLKINVGVNIQTSVNDNLSPLRGDRDIVKSPADQIASSLGSNFSSARPQGSNFSLGGETGAASQASRDLERAAERLQTQLGDLFKDLNQYGRRTSRQSLADLRGNAQDIVKGMREAIESAGQAGDYAMQNALQKQLQRFRYRNKILIELAKRRDRVLSQLTDARDNLRNLRQESREFSTSIRQDVIAFGDITQDTGGIRTTFLGMRRTLRNAITDTRQFSAAIEQLRSFGLNETSLRQIVAQGPEGGLDTARALARRGAAGVSEINALQGYLEDAGKDLASGLHDEFFAAGISTAEGLVRGLRSQEDRIVKAMDRIADKLVSSIKKKLRIASPSGVFEDEVGAPIAEGTAAGIVKRMRAAEDAARQLGRQTIINFGADAVQVSGVSDPRAAERAGALSGEAIADVLARRQAEAALSGGR